MSAVIAFINNEFDGGKGSPPFISFLGMETVNMGQSNATYFETFDRSDFSANNFVIYAIITPNHFNIKNNQRTKINNNLSCESNR